MTTAPTEKTKTLTAYIVLKFPAPAPKIDVTTASGEAATYATSGVAQKPGLQELGSFNALSPNAAIRSVIDKYGTGTYVAVPARSWKPVKVTIEQTTSVKLS